MGCATAWRPPAPDWRGTSIYDSGAMTRMVDQLEKRGLLTRTRSKDDRRVVELELTPDGRAMAARLLPRITDLWNGVLKDFSRSEFDTLVGLMAKLVDALEATPVVEPARKAGERRMRRLVALCLAAALLAGSVATPSTTPSQTELKPETLGLGGAATPAGARPVVDRVRAIRSSTRWWTKR